MEKRFTAPNSVLDQIKPFRNNKGNWVIQLPSGSFLHWIETTNNKPCSCSSKDLVMQQWRFKEQAEAIITYLKILWNEDENVFKTIDQFQSMDVTVDPDSEDNRNIT